MSDIDDQREQIAAMDAQAETILLELSDHIARMRQGLARMAELLGRSDTTDADRQTARATMAIYKSDFDTITRIKHVMNQGRAELAKRDSELADEQD